MIKYEPPYVVHMIEGTLSYTSSSPGVVYTSGSPDDAEAFASGLCDVGGALVEVRDAKGQLLRRFVRGIAHGSVHGVDDFLIHGQEERNSRIALLHKSFQVADPLIGVG